MKSGILESDTESDFGRAQSEHHSKNDQRYKVQSSNHPHKSTKGRIIEAEGEEDSRIHYQHRGGNHGEYNNNQQPGSLKSGVLETDHEDAHKNVHQLQSGVRHSPNNSAIKPKPSQGQSFERNYDEQREVVRVGSGNQNQKSHGLNSGGKQKPDSYEIGYEEGSEDFSRSRNEQKPKFFESAPGHEYKPKSNQNGTYETNYDSRNEENHLDPKRISGTNDLRPHSGVKSTVIETDRGTENYQFDTASQRSPNGLRQRSYKSGIDEILLLEEKIILGPGVEQVKIPVEILAIDDLEDVSSFSVTMNVKVSSNLKELKYEQTFFQIASSVVNKVLILGISRDKTFFVSCVTRKGKVETCYTQCQVKNTEYQIGIVVSDEGNFTELIIFVNGKNEASVVFTSTLDPIEGHFLFGSDSTLGGFQGEISEAIFYAKVLNPTEFKEAYTSKSLMKDKSVYQIRKEKKAYLDSTEFISKKKGLPVNLVRTQEVLKTVKTQEEPKPKETQNYRSEEEMNREIQIKMIEDLKDYIYEDEELFSIAQHLSCNFEWVFNVCSVLSPVIEHGDPQPKHTFPCLHSSLCQVEARFYPCYAITVDQFMKVLGKIDSKLLRDDIVNVAERINCLDISQEYGNFIYYDKLLVAIRNATLTKEEIQNLRKTKADEIEKQVIKSEDLKAKQGEQEVTNIIAYNLIPIFEGADYFDQRDFIEQYPDAILAKIILTLDKATSHIKYLHFTYKLKNGQIRDYEVGKPILAGIPGKELVHFTIDVNDNEFLTSVKASNFHSNNANKVINYLSFGLNTHPEGIAYGQFNAHPGELKSISIDLKEYANKKILGFYGAFRDDLVGLGVYVQEKVIVKPGEAEKVPQEKKEEIPNEYLYGDYVLTIPQVKQDWNEGRIQIIINRCAECIKHKSTTSHEEADYCIKFNDWGNRIKDYFPNADIIGNYDKPKVFGLFEVYIRGVGPQAERDEEGRIILHQNYTLPEKKTKFSQVLETLLLYTFEYGGSIEMAKIQDLYLQSNIKNISKKWSESHEHPVDIPERLNSTSKRRENGKIEDGTPVVCKHWACGARFNFDSMTETICQHHPGRYEFGSVHGLWPESWTCCRGAWEDPGCKKGKHDVLPASKFHYLCINHGDLNPKGENPDSACGRAFQDAHDECKYHQGYLLARGKNAKWSCCGEIGENAPPCVSTTHKNAEWPEEEAKLYFFTREVVNPGVYHGNDNPNKFSKRATSSGFFKKVKPYIVYEDPQRKKVRKLEATENEQRICTNWGCGKVYKEAENKKVRTCKSHPGKWDFGYTGITVTQATTEFLREQSDIVLWKPHWTCCRQSWATEGCTKTYHRGELESETVQPKYKWPEEDAQKYFRKTISNLWKKKLGTRYQLDAKQVAQKFDEYGNKYGSGGKIPLGLLPQFCDKLYLPLLVISEDLSPHIRFLQVVHHTAEPLLDDGQGNIDKKKFIEWWFANLDQ